MAVPAERLPAARPRRIYYPTSDGKPMGETEKHILLIVNTVTALRLHFQDRADVYVCGNNFVYWEEGNPKARVAPDTYVVFGVDRSIRDSYMAWKEGGRLPEVVFEFTSRKTRREDLGRKLHIYQDLMKVPEYFLFDPTQDYLTPALQGFRLKRGLYTRIEGEDQLHSESLNLDLEAQGVNLRFYDSESGKLLPFAEDLARTAEQEAARAEAAEAELKRLRAELDALRRGGGPE